MSLLSRLFKKTLYNPPLWKAKIYYEDFNVKFDIRLVTKFEKFALKNDILYKYKDAISKETHCEIYVGSNLDVAKKIVEYLNTYIDETV